MLKLGGACYSNFTTLTTGNFGEWNTEQSGVGAGCNNASVDYYLEIKINNETQDERRIIRTFDYLRSDTDEILNGSLSTTGRINFNLPGTDNIVIDGRTYARNMIKGVMRFEHRPQIPNTRVITFDVNSNDQANTSAIVMEYNSNGSDLIRHFTGTGLYKWDKDANLYVKDIFAEFLGSLTNRITKLFVQDININGTIDGSGKINLSGEITVNNKKVCLEDGTNCQQTNNTKILVSFISTVDGDLMKITKYLPLGTKATITDSIGASSWIIDKDLTIIGILWNADSNTRNDVSKITIMKSTRSKSDFFDTSISVDMQGSTKGSNLNFNVSFSQGDLVVIKYSTNGAGSGKIKDLSITLTGEYS